MLFVTKPCVLIRKILIHIHVYKCVCDSCLYISNDLSPEKNHSSLQWRHNGCDGVLNNRRIDCLLNRLFRRRSKKTSKLRDTGLSRGKVTGEFSAQRASNVENVSFNDVIMRRLSVKEYHGYTTPKTKSFTYFITYIMSDTICEALRTGASLYPMFFMTQSMGFGKVHHILMPSNIILYYRWLYFHVSKCALFSI